MKNIKVVFVQPVLPKYQISFFNLLERKLGSGSISVFADTSTENQLNQVGNYPPSFKVYNFPNNWMFNKVIWRFRLITTLLKSDYDIYVLNASTRDISQLISIFLLRLFRKKVLAWGMFHRIGGGTIIANCIYKYISRLSLITLTYSKRGFYEQLCRGVDKNKIREIGTAIDECAVTEVQEKLKRECLEKIINKHRLQDCKVILQVVRLSAIKRPQLLIEAARILNCKDEKIKIIIIGGGDLELEIQKKISEYNLEEMVVILGPIYDEEVLSLWFEISDVFVVPTCIGLSAHHAMSYGLPIVTDNNFSEQASEFEILLDGYNCLLYESGSPEDMAKKLFNLISNEALADEVGANGLKTVKTNASLENKVNNMIKSIEYIYET